MKHTALIVSVFAILLSVSAKAATSSSETQQHEIIFGSGLNNNGGTTGNLNLTGGNINFGINAGYNYAFMPGLMIGLAPTFSYAGASAATTFGWMGVITLNFWPWMTNKFSDAFFVDGGAGTSTALGVTSFQFGFEVGKRFELSDHFTYRPSFAAVDAGGTWTFLFNVIEFSAVL